MGDIDSSKDQQGRKNDQMAPSLSGFTPKLQTEAVRVMDMLLKVLKKKDGVYRQQDEATHALESISNYYRFSVGLSPL